MTIYIYIHYTIYYKIKLTNFNNYKYTKYYSIIYSVYVEIIKYEIEAIEPYLLQENFTLCVLPNDYVL